jgi:hypothetical protein
MAVVTSYATLVTEVGNVLHRTDLSADIPYFLQLGEFRIYRELRVRQMETALSSAISSGVIAIPSGYLEMKFAYVNSSPTQKLQRKDAEWIYHNYPTRSSDGVPQFFAREAGNFIFGPHPDSTYTVKGVYFKQLTLLSASNTTNWLITDAPDLIYYAALCEAAPWLRDDSRIPIWEGRYNLAKTRVQKADEAEEFSGSPLFATVR